MIHPNSHLMGFKIHFFILIIFFLIPGVTYAHPLIEQIENIEDKKPLREIQKDITTLENDINNYRNKTSELDKNITVLRNKESNIIKENEKLKKHLNKKENETKKWERRENLQKKTARIIGGGAGFVIGFLGSVIVLYLAWRDRW